MTQHAGHGINSSVQRANFGMHSEGPLQGVFVERSVQFQNDVNAHVSRYECF